MSVRDREGDPGITRDEADDLVIQALAQSELQLKEMNRLLVALVADLVLENHLLRSRYVHILTVVDDARTEAQQQCEALWTALADDDEAVLNQGPEVA